MRVINSITFLYSDSVMRLYILFVYATPIIIVLTSFTCVHACVYVGHEDCKYVYTIWLLASHGNYGHQWNVYIGAVWLATVLLMLHVTSFNSAQITQVYSHVSLLMVNPADSIIR